MNYESLLCLGTLVLAMGCGDTTASGGGGGAHAGGSNAGGSPEGGQNAGGANQGGQNAGGGTAGGTAEGGGTIVFCTENPDDPAACEQGQACACGGPGGGLVCECGDICMTDDDCTNPAQPTCCGAFEGQAGSCTSTCTCLCD